MQIRKLLSHALGLGERRCPVCYQVFERELGQYFCSSCRLELEKSRRFNHELCKLCGFRLSFGQCERCSKNKAAWEELFFIGQYDGLLRNILLQAKYGGDYILCRILGKWLGDIVVKDGIDIVIPMPLHEKRLRSRGYNQCGLMAANLSKCLELKYKDDYARRINYVRPQTGLHYQERLKNIGQAFWVSPLVKGKSVLLLDDTMTTGTSLRSLAVQAKQAGAIKVSVAVVALTLLKK